MTIQVNLWETLGAFAAGFLSFISPCILPIIPSYIAYITGVSFEELTDKEKSLQVRKKVLTHSLLFVMGFSLIFVMLGATATTVGAFLRQHLNIITKIAGVIIFLLGLHLTGLIKVKFLMQEHRMDVKEKPAGLIGSLLMGIAFGAGWTPCVGPFLASALALASSKGTAVDGIILLGGYSIGLGIPFILAALGMNTFMSYSQKIKKHFQIFTTASGVLLMIMGILVFTGLFGDLSMRLLQ
jgi:cytochrome c-type biogenesis protein